MGQLKLMKQLRFWRSRNWFSQHHMLIDRNNPKIADTTSADHANAKVLQGVMPFPKLEPPPTKHACVMVPKEHQTNPQAGRQARNFQIPQLQLERLQQSGAVGQSSRQTSVRGFHSAHPDMYSNTSLKLRFSQFLICSNSRSPVQTHRAAHLQQNINGRTLYPSPQKTIKKVLKSATSSEY